LREKLRVTTISAGLTALGGALFVQYLMYLNPETVSGIGVSLQIVFAAIVGGMYTMLGPTVGALLTISLNEGLRVAFATNFIGAANTIYGILLILCIIFMPRGILGVLENMSLRRAQSKMHGNSEHKQSENASIESAIRKSGYDGRLSLGGEQQSS
jgi:branched-chain amino acid transport system permease protein